MAFHKSGLLSDLGDDYTRGDEVGEIGTDDMHAFGPEATTIACAQNQRKAHSIP